MSPDIAAEPDTADDEPPDGVPETTPPPVPRGHGLLRSHHAVFGCSRAAWVPPEWVDSDDEIETRLVAKPSDDDVEPQTWLAVGRLASACRYLSPWSPESAVDLRLSSIAKVLALQAIAMLPMPPPDADAPTCVIPDVEASSYWLHRVYAALRPIVDALDDPHWTDPKALAGWTYDVLNALHGYQATR